MENPLRSLATSNASSTASPLLVEDQKYRAALLARASKIATRVAAAAARGRDGQAEARAAADRRIEERCDQAMHKREEAAEKRRQLKAREEEARQTKANKQAAKQAESAAKKKRKAEKKKEEAQRKAEKKAERARGKERKQYLGGMAWGYDPKAGVSACLPADIQTSRYRGGERDSGSRGTPDTALSAEIGPRYYDRVTGKYYRKSEFDSAWGIEVGGPTRSMLSGPHRDRFAKAIAEVDKTSRTDRGGLSRDPGPSQEALTNVKGKGRTGAVVA